MTKVYIGIDPKPRKPARKPKRFGPVIVEWRIEEDGKFGPISDETVARLHRRISALKRKSDFKIGFTNNPDKRASQYDSSRYYQMVVLYETGSDERVRKLEAMLIGKHREDSDNEIGGGGGPKGKGKRYLYIVRSRPRKKVRRTGISLPRKKARRTSISRL